MYHPQEDSYLIVQLPGEKLRAIIRRVVTDDAVVVELTSVPLSRTGHNYQRGDYVACRRKETLLGEIWEAVAEQRISIEQVAEKEKVSAAKPVKKTKKKKQTVSVAKKKKKGIK